MGWLKKHPRWYAIGGVLVVIGGGLAAFEGIWSLFSPDPFIPFIVTRVAFTSPLWIRWVVTLVFVCLTIFGIIIVIAIFRQTRTPKIPILSDGIQPVSFDKRDAIISKKEHIEPLELIDSFPKDNEAITTEDVKKIFLRFNKPIDRKTVGYISNYYIRRNSRCQWNICGWIEFSENDTKLIWHVHDRLLQNKDEYGSIDIDYPTFEIRIGLPTEDWKLKATDSSKLPETIIRVKIKPDVSPSQTNGIQPIVKDKKNVLGVKNAVPNIHTELEVSDKRFNLVVRNIGGKGGLFTASGRVIVGKPKSGQYVMYWEDLGEKCQINGGGGIASILIAEKAPRTIMRDAETSIYEGGLALFKWSGTSEQTFPVHTWMKKPRIVNGKKGFEMHQEDKCILEITITSDPPLLEEFGSRKYALEIDHKNRDELLFTEIPIPDKGDSQT